MYVKEAFDQHTRSSGADEALRLVPPMIMSLEKCLEFMGQMNCWKLLLLLCACVK